MAESEKQKRKWERHEKYRKEHFDRFNVQINFEDKQPLQTIAKSHDLSMNRYVCNCIYDAIQKDISTKDISKCSNSSNGVYSFAITVKKGEKAKIQEYIQSKGDTLNGFIKTILHNEIVKELGVEKTDDISDIKNMPDELELEKIHKRTEHSKKYRKKHFECINFLLDVGLRKTIKEIAECKGTSAKKYVYNSVFDIMNGNCNLDIDDALIAQQKTGGTVVYHLFLKKGEKAKVQEYAQSIGKTTSGFVKDAIMSAITKDNSQVYADNSNDVYTDNYETYGDDYDFEELDLTKQIKYR